MGFYPVCPATDQYVLGAPLFKKITVTLENGKEVVINAPKNSSENKYVNSLKLNGKVYENNWLGHFDLMKGGILNFDMIAEPNAKRGTDKKSFPYSFTNENK